MKRKNKVTNPATEKLAGIVVREILIMQTRWASFMQRKTERLSVKSKKYFLVIFSILTVTCSCCIIASAFTGHSGHAFSVTRIQLPKTIHEDKRSPVSDKEYLQIERYKKYMDSCGLQVRPGLADSIKLFEIIYQSFKK